VSIMNTQLGEIKAGQGKINSIVLTSGLCCVAVKMYTVKRRKTTGVQTGC